MIAGAATNATINFSYKNKYTANEAEKQESKEQRKSENNRQHKSLKYI